MALEPVFLPNKAIPTWAVIHPDGTKVFFNKKCCSVFDNPYYKALDYCAAVAKKALLED